MPTLLAFLLTILSASAYAQGFDKSICQSDDANQFMVKGQYKVFLNHRDYQVYPSYTALKRSLLSQQMATIGSRKAVQELCFEAKSLMAAAKVLDRYLSLCLDPNIEVGYRLATPDAPAALTLNRGKERSVIHRCQTQL